MMIHTRHGMIMARSCHGGHAFPTRGQLQNFLTSRYYFDESHLVSNETASDACILLAQVDNSVVFNVVFRFFYRSKSFFTFKIPQKHSLKHTRGILLR